MAEYSSAEDLFIELFADTFGAEKAGYLYSQYPFYDIYQNARFADFVLENGAKHTNLPIYFFNGENCKFGKDFLENYIFFVKRDHFIQEHEFRIVITVPDELLPKLKENGIYKFRISNGVLIPYIELAFSEDVVKSVTISPTVRSDLVELSIQDFMKYYNYDIQGFSEFIRHSKVPVRF